MDIQELQRGDLVPRSLNELADAINSEYRQSQALFQKGVTHSRNMGEYLLKVKEQVEHGQWLPWLSANCPDVAERTAQACMRLARNWGTIEGKSATVADLTINEALKLIPLKVDPVSDRYLQWYDHKADEVWGNKIKHVMAFRRVVTYPDIMDRLSTEQILPLAQAVYDEHLRLDRDITEGSIESAVKQRFKETFTKKREEESKHNELVRELRDGAVAFRKSQSAINRVEQLTKNNPDIINKTGFAGLGFIDELSNLNSQLLHKANNKPEKEIFEVLPALPATIEADNELEKLRNENNELKKELNNIKTSFHNAIGFMSIVGGIVCFNEESKDVYIEGWKTVENIEKDTRYKYMVFINDIINYGTPTIRRYDIYGKYVDSIIPEIFNQSTTS